jgi:CheY-like chemotaxis protein
MEALEYNKIYDLILFALVSGFRFRATDETGKMFKRDEDFVRLLNEKGFDHVMETICGIDPKKQHLIYKKAREIYKDISKDYSKLLNDIDKNISWEYSDTTNDMDMKSKLVFFVDDDKMILNLLEYIFRSKPDFKIKTFENCEECISQLNQKPDVIVLDHLFPSNSGMSGFEALKKIISVDQNSKVIMLLSQEDQKMIPEFIRSGAKKYIPKDSYFIDSLFEAIQDVIKNN